VRLIFGLLWLLAGPYLEDTSAADRERIYLFLDENNVPHYSNVPADPRYRPFFTSTYDQRLNTPAQNMEEQEHVLQWAPVDEGEKTEEPEDGEYVEQVEAK
jgi:hypothetical protein